MNPVFLLFNFLFIRSSNAKCRLYDFKLQLEPNDCACNDLSHSPGGRIFNGTNLDRYDLLYVAALYGEESFCKLLLLKENFIKFF